jgi:DNA-binding transcriptional MerR regulator
MATYFTTGQVARRLRVSISTLKRWLTEKRHSVADRRNQHGWRLFSEADLDMLKEHKRKLKRNGKRFNETTLIPIIINGAVHPEKVSAHG